MTCMVNCQSVTPVYPVLPISVYYSFVGRTLLTCYFFGFIFHLKSAFSVELREQEQQLPPLGLDPKTQLMLSAAGYLPAISCWLILSCKLLLSCNKLLLIAVG